MRRRQRLRAPRDFRRVLGTGAQVTRPEFVLYHAAGKAAGEARAGFTVSRRVGSAVVRNRTRRRLREAFRKLSPRLEPCDVVVVVRPAAAEASHTELEAALTEAVGRAGLYQTEPFDEKAPR